MKGKWVRVWGRLVKRYGEWLLEVERTSYLLLHPFLLLHPAIQNLRETDHDAPFLVWLEEGVIIGIGIVESS